MTRWLLSRFARRSGHPRVTTPANLRLVQFEDRVNPVNMHGGEGATFNLSATGTVGISEGSIGDQSDAFDSFAGQLKVDGTTATGKGTLNGQTASYPTVTISGLNVTPQLFIAPSSATAREFVTFQNPTAADITVTVVLSTNLGSDGATQIVTTSSGNATLETADRWVITDDANLTGADPTVTTVLSGPGAPAVTPTAVTDPVAGNGNFDVTYSLTVPAGGTKALMFFYQLNPTSTAATTDANSGEDFWSLNGVAGNDILAGLTDAQLANVANWKFGTGANNTLHAGEGSSWNVSNTGEVQIIDASIGAQSDAYDSMGRVSVDGTFLTGVPTLQGNAATYPAVTISGLTVSSELFAAPSSATMRELVSFANPTVGNITVTVVMNNNLGSDGTTQIVTTSSGNATLETADRWVITDDANLTGADPTVTTVLSGPGAPAVTPTAVTDPVAGSGTFTVTYSLTVPAGQTRSLLFFHQLNGKSTEAVADASFVASFWATNPVAGNDVLAGLTDAQLATIANWQFGTGANNNLHGGEGTSWNVSSTGQIDLNEATIGDQSDAYDSMGRVSVDGTFLTGVPTLQGNSASYPSVAVSGLNVSSEFFAAPSSATMRELVSFANPTAGDITVTVVMNNNLGSDAGTQIVTTGSGDATFTITDGWLVTDDANLTGGDPAVTTVLFGPGSPLTPTAVTDPTGTGNFTVTYSLTIPAGQTKSLVFFHQINPTAAGAQLDDNLFFTGTPVVGNDLFAGLSAAQRGQIANYLINTAPTAADDTATVAEDAAATAVTVLANDFDADGDTLTVTAVTAPANGTVTITGGGSQVTYQPNANFTGNDTFTYTVSDGAGGSKTATVTVTVTPVNDLPTVSDIADQTTANGVAAGPIAFTVGDVETAAGTLTVAGTSSNTALVPNANITFGGTGANRTVTVTPVAGATGTATITVTVSDADGGTATDTFVVTVGAPNTSPTISDITDRTTSVGVAVGPISFTVGDAETAAGSLTVTGTSSNTTLIPNANIVFGGSGANRTITVTPAAGQTGTATITVTVADGNGGTATDTFTVTVTAPPTAQPIAVGGLLNGTAQVFNPSGGKFAAGANQTFFAGSKVNVRTASADVNGDGVADFIGGTGPGQATSVVVIDGKTGATIATISPFEASFTGGVFVAAADITGDGKADVIVTPDQGGGPVAAIYSGAKLAAGQTNDAAQVIRYFAIDDPAFRGGARPTAGDITGDGVPEVIVSAGFLGGPRITIWGGTSVQSGTPVQLLNFFAFEDTLRNGAFVAAGDMTGDGKADIAFGGGPGGAPRVRVFDGAALLAAGLFANLDQVAVGQVGNFFAGDSSLRGGVRLAVGNVDGDGKADLITGSGEGETSRVRVYLGPTVLANPASPSTTQEIDPFGVALANGVFVG